MKHSQERLGAYGLAIQIHAPFCAKKGKSFGASLAPFADAFYGDQCLTGFAVDSEIGSRYCEASGSCCAERGRC